MYQKDYHEHSENDVYGATILMGHNYITGNNLNLIEPIGQFGTRYFHGTDHAQPKYLSTRLEGYTNLLFPEADLHALEYNNNDEPSFLLPILPLTLINGCEVDNLWRSTVFPRKASKVIQAIKGKLSNSGIFDSKLLAPSWQFFRGGVEQKQSRYFLKCHYSRHDKFVKICDILPMRSMKEYKTYLEEYLKDGKRDPLLESIQELHRGDQVEFIVKFIEGKMPSSNEQIEKILKLTEYISEKSIILWNSEGKVKRYECIQTIVDEFYENRLKGYQLRKNYLISEKMR